MNAKEREKRGEGRMTGERKRDEDGLSGEGEEEEEDRERRNAFLGELIPGVWNG